MFLLDLISLELWEAFWMSSIIKAKMINTNPIGQFQKKNDQMRDIEPHYFFLCPNIHSYTGLKYSY